MIKVSPAVKKETLFIALWEIVFSLLMQGVFLVLQSFGVFHWTLACLWGNLAGGVLAVANFFLLGVTIGFAVEKEAKDASKIMQLSRTWRLLGTALLIVLVISFLETNIWATLLPLLFPRLALIFRKKNDDGGDKT